MNREVFIAMDLLEGEDLRAVLERDASSLTRMAEVTCAAPARR